MAVTTLTYSGNGVLADFALTFDYTTTAAIEVYVDAVLQTASTDYIFTTPTNIQFQPGSIPPSGTDNIEFRRNTPTAPLVDFTAGASIQDTDLDLFVAQTLHVLEELENQSVDALTRTGANWDGENDRITNVAPPIADTDVATQASIATQVAAADASVVTAESWANFADLQATNAAASYVDADLAKVAAEAAAFAASNDANSISNVYPVNTMVVGELLRATAFDEFSSFRSRYPVFVTEGTITNDLLLDIELTGGFDEYLLEIREYRPDTDNTKLQLRFSDDNAVTYESSLYDYALTGNDAGAGTGDEDGNGAAQIVLAIKQGTTAPEYCDIDLSIFRGSTTVFPRVRGTGITLDNDSDTSVLVMGGQHRALPPAAGITHIRLFSSGVGARLLSGNYTLWGINKS